MEILKELVHFHKSNDLAFLDQVLGMKYQPYPEFDETYSLSNIKNALTPYSDKYQTGSEDQHLVVGDILDYIPNYWALGWKNFAYIYPIRADGG